MRHDCEKTQLKWLGLLLPLTVPPERQQERLALLLTSRLLLVSALHLSHHESRVLQLHAAVCERVAERGSRLWGAAGGGTRQARPPPRLCALQAA